MTQPAKTYRITVALMLAITACMFYFYGSSDTVPLGDDIFYSYNIDGADPRVVFEGRMPDDSQKIKSLSDVIASQRWHYLYFNGRSLVSAVEQFFTGVANVGLFNIINTLVFILTLYLTARCANSKRNLWIWVVTIVAYLFLFPGESTLFTNINLSVNYLWPIAMTLGGYLMWCDSRDNAKPINRWSWLLLIACVILGWSHEGYSLPLVATIGVYYLANFKSFRSRQALIAVGLAIGALICAFSPGNFVRMELGNGTTLSQFFVKGPTSLWMPNIFWILVATIAITSIFNRLIIKRWIRSNRFTLTWLGFSLLFIIAFHTFPRSYAPVDMVSLLLLISLISQFRQSNKSLCNIVLPCVTFIVVIAFYGYAGVWQHRVERAERAAVNAYISGERIATPLDLPDVPDFIEPFTVSKLPAWFNNAFVVWETTGRGGTMFFINHQEKDFIASPRSYKASGRRLGNGLFTCYGNSLHAWTLDSDVLNHQWTLHMGRPTPAAFKFLPKLLVYSISPKLLKNTLDTGANPYVTESGDTLYFIHFPPGREVIDITPID